MDYGGGVGDKSIMSREHGFDAYYCDVYGPTFKFANWRFERRNLNIKMTRIFDDAPLKVLRFDIITCFEVLEHLPNL